MKMTITHGKYIAVILMATLLLMLTVSCSSPPADYKIEGRLLSDRYTPAVTRVSLSLGAENYVSPEQLSNPDLSTDTDSTGRFRFQLTHDQVYLNGTMRAMALQGSQGSKKLTVFFYPDGPETDLGSLVLWADSPDQWLEGNDVVFKWDPLYKSTGMSTDKDTLLIYCGEKGELCWEEEIEDSGEFRLPAKVLFDTPMCWRLQARSETDTRVFIYSSDRGCMTDTVNYPDPATQCNVTINGKDGSILRDGNILTTYGGDGLNEIEFQCPTSIVFSTIVLYNFRWVENREEYTEPVELGVFSSDSQLLFSGKISGSYGYVPASIPYNLTSFTIRVLTPGVYFTNAGEVKIAE